MHPLDDSATALVCSDGKVLVFKFATPPDPLLKEQPQPRLNISDSIVPVPMSSSRNLVMARMMQSIPSAMLCMRMSPGARPSLPNIQVTAEPRKGKFGAQNSFNAGDLTDRESRPNLAAFGTVNGSVCVFDMAICSMERQFFIYPAPIRGVDWAGSFIVCFCTDENNTANATHRNLVARIDCRNGKVTRMKEGSDDSSAIAAVRVSTLGQYLVIM